MAKTSGYKKKMYLTIIYKMNYDQGYKHAMDTILGIMHSDTNSLFTIQEVEALEPLYNDIVAGMVYAKKQFEMNKVNMAI